VPTSNSCLGVTARLEEPEVWQAFFVPTAKAKVAGERDVWLERLCYIIRQRCLHRANPILTANGCLGRDNEFYIASLSARTVVYKGQLTPAQVGKYYPELREDTFASHLAMVHSRFSTNTFPSWARSQPNRVMSHNGEINTLRGNVNWMKARQGLISAASLGIDEDILAEVLPVVPEGLSDSGALNAALELLMASGRPLPECVMMLIPEAWQNNDLMDPKRREFYEYMSCLMEPWDGPALVAFTDGRYVGATLDRNGLRPGRFIETKDHRLIMASEFGVVDVQPSNVIRKGRLCPGKMLMIDFDVGRVVEDDELKARFVNAKPYGDWLRSNYVDLEDLVSDPAAAPPLPTAAAAAAAAAGGWQAIIPDLATFGWTQECLDLLVVPMFKGGVEALGSMGNDAPLACLSQRPKPVFDFFKQLFAQVTNPPLDSTRESIVMSLECPVGPESDITLCTPEHAKRLRLKSPLISRRQLWLLEHADRNAWRCVVLDATYPVSEGSPGLLAAINRLRTDAARAVAEGATLLLLSDRIADKDRVPVSCLLSVGAVHHELIRLQRRMRAAIVVDSGEPREVHHFCLLVGFGADAVCPRLALEVAARFVGDERLAPVADSDGKDHKPAATRPTAEQLEERFFYAVGKGMLKVMAKMGISTLHSYKGAQIFEAVGLASEVIDICFVATASRVEGMGFSHIGDAYLAMHAMAYPESHLPLGMLPNPGDYYYRSNENSERHLNDPEAITKLQEAARQNSTQAYADYARIINDINRHTTLRGLLRFRGGGSQAIPLDEVEPAADIVKRFCTGAMSYGSISLEAHSTLAKAMNSIGGKSNTGEGGEAASRLHPLPGNQPNPERSAIKQIASGRFGVTSLYLTNADELQIKMAQGAKPGEGGELPGRKVNSKIAKVRHSTPGVGLISPPPHHDIYSIEDLKQLIFDLKNSNPEARISVKLVSAVGVGVVAAGVAKAGAGHVLISGHDGGTGASRWTGIKHAGLPWELGLAETHQTLVLNDLRRRIVVQTDGQLKTGRDIAVGALLGAEEFCFATAPLIAMGCIMMRKCHLNTCPVGIATQDPVLRKKFAGAPEQVVNFFFLMAEEVRQYMAHMGFRKMDDMIGRADMLEVDEELMKETPQYACFNLKDTLLKPASELREAPQRCVEAPPDDLVSVLDRQLIVQAGPSLEDPHRTTRITTPIHNTDRATGTMLSHQITKRYSMAPLADDTVHIHFTGSAGQSFGAWVCQGMTLELEGDANDYLGKGLCGGRIIVYPPPTSAFKAEENILLGNVAIYGGTSGEVFLRGCAAERFCVRNSGVTAVVEAVGDHGCEYMTGGRVVILGLTGRNFAAGMSGGVAYVLDVDGLFHKRCNMELVGLESLDDTREVAELKELIEKHQRLTRSALAERLLVDWDATVRKFVKIIPHDYKRALMEREKRRQKRRNLSGVSKATAPALASDVEDIGGVARAAVNNKMAAPLDEDVAASGDASSSDTDDSGVADVERPSVVAKPDKKRGFIEYERAVVGYRPAGERAKDWKEIGASIDADDQDKLLVTQTARCMDCGVPFCHQKNTGCPLGNRIPEWNELVHRGEWRMALDALLATNNFPEFTGRVCPAPCEGACVLGIIEKPVAIKSVECAIIDHAFAEGWIVPKPPLHRSGRTVGIIGSGPAGLAAADQLNKAGHLVTVYERADRIGGLMMYGVPNMKCDKEDVVQRRVNLMAAEGVIFKTGVEVGKSMPVAEIRAQHDALLLACGSTVPNNLPIPGRDLKNIHFAMDFLTANTKSLLDSKHADKQFIDVKDKDVIVIGGGDTGNDCIGTSVRQGARSVTNFELMPEPPQARADDNPWPQWPRIFRVDYGHEEVAANYGRDPRRYCVLSERFVDNGEGAVAGIDTIEVEWITDAATGRRTFQKVAGTEKHYKADFVFLAMGFRSPEQKLAQDLGLELDARSNYKADDSAYRTSADDVFAAGDCRRGQSLVVWAIAEGRNAAASIDAHLEKKARA
jgi:glutamate synthase (NADPH/NADH)